MYNTVFSMDNLPESERLEQCPYNKAHMVVKHRMAMHLVKCRRSASTKDTRTCRFNAMHVVATEDIEYHENQCPDRILVERFIDAHEPTEDKDKDSGIQSAPSSVVVGDAVTEQDWDHLEGRDGLAATVKRAENRNVIFHIQHGTPSEKKARRAQEAERLNRIRNPEE